MDEILPKAFDAVRRLRDPYREAISLHYFHGLSLQETAEVLKVPIGTVKTLVARGLKALRKELGADLDSGRE
jgi:RNA polymerase sigma-70 factor (ECF subfamily)